MMIMSFFVIKASGEIIVVQVTGTVDSVSAEGSFSWDNSVTVGSTMTGFCCYDPALMYDHGVGDYYGEYSIDLWSMTIGNYTFKENPASLNLTRFRIWKTDITYEFNTSDGMAILNDTFLGYDNVDVTLFDLSNFSLGGPDDELPTSFPDISVFKNRHDFLVSFSDGTTGFNLSGTIDYIAAIPEPMSISFFSVCGMVLIRKQNWKV
jgi:hypothetical protein